MIGDPGYVLQIDAAYAAGLITATEHAEQIRSDAISHRAQSRRSIRVQCD